MSDMQLESIELKIGEDDWVMDFYTDFDIYIAVRYKGLCYQFEFDDLDDLKRDCKKLAEVGYYKRISFGQETVSVTDSYFKDFIHIHDGQEGIAMIGFAMPEDLGNELKKRFCEPEKPKLEVGDIALFAWEVSQANYTRQTQYIGNNTFFDVFENSRTTAQDQFVRGRKLAKVYRLGVKIWEAGE